MPEIVHLLGEYGECLTYAEACGLVGGEWIHVDTLEKMQEVPEGGTLVLVCTDKVYWSLEGYWHQEDFTAAIWDRELWFTRADLAEA